MEKTESVYLDEEVIPVLERRRGKRHSHRRPPCPAKLMGAPIISGTRRWIEEMERRCAVYHSTRTRQRKPNIHEISVIVDAYFPPSKNSQEARAMAHIKQAITQALRGFDETTIFNIMDKIKLRNGEVASEEILNLIEKEVQNASDRGKRFYEKL